MFRKVQRPGFFVIHAACRRRICRFCALLELSTSIALYLSLISPLPLIAATETPPIDGAKGPGDSFHQEKYFLEFGNNGRLGMFYR